MTFGARPGEFRPPGRRAGWRYERLGFVLAALTAAVTAGVQVSGKVEGPLWAFLLLYVVAFVLAAATAWIKLRSTGFSEDRRWVGQVQHLLALSAGEDGSLARLSALNPYGLGVSPSRCGSQDQRGDDLYVPRHPADERLDQALGERAFVLLVGDSKAGKVPHRVRGSPAAHRRRRPTRSAGGGSTGHGRRGAAA